MAVIEKNPRLMTLVNIFTVKPDKQGGLAAWLAPGLLGVGWSEAMGDS